MQPQSEESLIHSRTGVWAAIWLHQLSTCRSANPTPKHLVSQSLGCAPEPSLDSPSYTCCGRVPSGKGEVGRVAALGEGHLGYARIHSTGSGGWLQSRGQHKAKRPATEDSPGHPTPAPRPACSGGSLCQRARGAEPTPTRARRMCGAPSGLALRPGRGGCVSRLLGRTPGSATLCGNPKRWCCSRAVWRWASVSDAIRASPCPRGPRSIAGTDLPDVSPGRFSTADPRLWRWSPATAH